MNKELNYKNHLDEKLMELPFLAEVRAIEDRLDVSEETAMDLKEFYLKYRRNEMELPETTLREFLEKIEADVESEAIDNFYVEVHLRLLLLAKEGKTTLIVN